MPNNAARTRGNSGVASRFRLTGERTLAGLLLTAGVTIADELAELLLGAALNASKGCADFQGPVQCDARSIGKIVAGSTSQW